MELNEVAFLLESVYKRIFNLILAPFSTLEFFTPILNLTNVLVDNLTSRFYA
jgi:hypothetical protein